MTKIKNFFRNEDGATAIEYGLIAALISVVIIAGVLLVGENLANAFNFIGSEVGRATTDIPVPDPAAGN